MSVLDFSEIKSFGMVQSVDTSSVVVKVDDTDQLSNLQVNHFVAIRSSKTSQFLIGLVNKIMRKFSIDTDKYEEDDLIPSADIVKINLVGTFLDKDGTKSNVFKRTLESVPEIDSEAFILSGSMLTDFMASISSSDSEMENPLCIGRYAINEEARAWLDGNKLFQRHAVIVGSTGSGKSYTVAALIEKIAELKSSNAVLFDIHGEYEPIVGEGIKHYKIAGPTASLTDGIMFLPYWLLNYEEMISLMLDRSDSNAPNQAMMFSKGVLDGKKKYLTEKGISLADGLTIDSPTPYDIKKLIEYLEYFDKERIPGSNGKDKNGDFNGKLSRFIQRLSAKISDKRLNFMFSADKELLEYDYMNVLCKQLMAPASQSGGVKIIDFSEVPSDILPLMVSLIARLIFSVQQWIDKDNLNPIAIFCDEAHLYIPANAQQGVEISSLHSFERISKEGRKYGVGLVVISQRPSEVNHTVLSQSSNFIAMRLTNAEDQNVIKKLLPDSIGNFADILPILNVGEAIAVGDSSLLPSRILIDKPKIEPNSATVKFWTEWNRDNVPDNIDSAVEALRKQSKE